MEKNSSFFKVISFPQAVCIACVTYSKWLLSPALPIPSLAPRPWTPWPHTTVRHPLWCHSSKHHYSTQVMCCTQDCVHLRAHSCQAVIIFSSFRQSTINCCGSAAVADIFSVHTAIPLYSQQMEKLSVTQPLGTKRGNTFSAGNCVVNYDLSGGLCYYIYANDMPLLLI